MKTTWRVGKKLKEEIIMRSLIAYIVFGLILSFAISAYSQTADEMTPAEEDVCSELQGAAYGLCNAYCEAMDCDTVEGYDQHPNACDKVLANFEKKTDGGIPPCELPMCSDSAIACGFGDDFIECDGEVLCRVLSCNDDCNLCLFRACPRPLPR